MSSDEANWIVRAAESARRHSRGSWKVLLPTAAALGAGAAVAIGQIPGPGATISACYQDVSPGTNGVGTPYGTLRIIDPSATTASDPRVYSCNPATENTISWNQQGPPGPQGPSGTMVGSTAFTFKKSGHAKIFLNLSGTASKLAQHIPLDSFSFGSEGTIAPGSPGAGAGAGAGKVTIHSFQFVKQVDPSDATLTRDQVTGTVIKEADVFFVSASTKAQAAEYKLAEVVITTIQKSASGQETVSGTFAKIDATLGSGSTKLSTGWMNPGFTIVTNKTP